MIALSRREFVVTKELGNGVHLLHEEPDHTLAIVAVCWLPGRETRPHDHGTCTIHSVANDTPAITLTLHVYGKHLNFGPRSQFHVEKHTESRRRTVLREG